MTVVKTGKFLYGLWAVFFLGAMNDNTSVKIYNVKEVLALWQQNYARSQFNKEEAFKFLQKHYKMIPWTHYYPKGRIQTGFMVDVQSYSGNEVNLLQQEESASTSGQHYRDLGLVMHEMEQKKKQKMLESREWVIQQLSMCLKTAVLQEALLYVIEKKLTKEELKKYSAELVDKFDKDK